MAKPVRPKAPREPGEVEAKFESQLAALRKSCKDFDSGDLWEAERISAAVQTICHSRGQTIGLLDQLGLKGRMFLNSSVWDAHALTENCGLVVVEVGPGHLGWRAELDDSHMEFQPFEDWWSSPVMGSGAGDTLSRQQLIEIMRNQDGGGHVDPVIDRVYQALQNDIGYIDGQGLETTGLHKYAVRQIGHELLKSLVSEYQRKPPKSPKVTSLVAGMLIHDVTEGEHPSPSLIDYRTQARAAPCGCGSGKKFASCHALGGKHKPPPISIGSTV